MRGAQGRLERFCAADEETGGQGKGGHHAAGLVQAGCGSIMQADLSTGFRLVGVKQVGAVGAPMDIAIAAGSIGGEILALVLVEVV